MSHGPEALPPGTLLGGRFEVERVLGRGGFGIAYLVADVVRHDKSVVKELAPVGTRRGEGGMIDLESGNVSGHRLRQNFLEEARHLSRLDVSGVLPMRAVFTENGTAYYATDYLPDAVSLDRVLIQEGRLDAEGAMDILFQVIETLETVHRKGILHRDIKPSNILLTPKGRAFLIDFGSAREWHADAATTHTVLYTPGYAPLEQLSEKGRRGPATDIYALSATAYRMLTGTVPLPATDRAAGSEMPNIRLLRPDLEPAIARAIDAGLAVRYHDRPQTVAEYRELLSAEEEAPEEGSLAAYDAKLLRLQTFSYERRQCPACRGVLEQPKPLRRWCCPVCREGTVRRREIETRLCPACQIGTLHRRPNDKPLAFCPLCRVGQLSVHKAGILNRKVTMDCLSCSASMQVEEDQIRVLTAPTNPLEGEARSAEEWREHCRRSAEVWMCDGCEAQYDLLQDGRWEQVSPKPKKYHALYPEEWARVAANLPPGSGNAVCDSCRADYFVEGEHITLLTTEVDPHHFAAEHLGRLLNLDDVRWLGVGKTSPNPGFVCMECGTELDIDGDYLRLVQTSAKALLRNIGEPKKLIDWHRLAMGLPEIHEEQEFRTDVLAAITFAYDSAELGFDTKNELLWKGPASRDGQAGTLTISDRELLFGGLLRKTRIPLDALVSATAKGDSLEILPGGETEPHIYHVAPVELTVHLTSGNHSVMLNAENLAKRIRTAIEKLKTRTA